MIEQTSCLSLIIFPILAFYSFKNVSVNYRPNFRVGTLLKRTPKVSLIRAIRTNCPNSRKKSAMSPARVIGRIHFRQPHAEPLMANIFSEYLTRTVDTRLA